MKRTIGYLGSCAVLGAMITLAACSKKDDKLPAIDGYNSSDEIAATNLVAHWTFDGTYNEAISSSAPSTTQGGVSFQTTGVIGQALKLDAGALVYPVLPKLSDAGALNAFTVSMWIQMDGTKGTPLGLFSPVFSLSPESQSDIWPDIFMGAETSRHKPGSDTLELKILLNTHPEAGKDQEDNIAQPNPNPADGNPDFGTGAWFQRTGGASAWVHFVAVWDPANHKWHMYGNGADIGGYSTRANTGVEILAIPVHAIFGSLASSDLGFTAAPATQPWAGLWTGGIDDVRIYNAALAQKDISALLDLGKAGR